MGQKVNANSARLGIVKDFKSRYYAPGNKDWDKFIYQDKIIRDFLDKYRRDYAIDSIEIERVDNVVKVIINTAKPGVVLGQNGENIKSLQKKLERTVKDRSIKIQFDVMELKHPDLSAQLAAEDIAIALENRGSFRLAQKRVIRRVMKSGAKGIKTRVSGRLNGVDMARAEGYSHGVVPLQTFRNDITYGFAEANTTYGIIGVKVWISKGEVINGLSEFDRDLKNKPRRMQRPPRRVSPDLKKDDSKKEETKKDFSSNKPQSNFKGAKR